MMNNSNKGGRPKLGLSEVKKYRLSIRIAAADYYRIKSMVAESGLSQNEILRKLIENTDIIPRLKPEEADYIRKLVGMANNLNQLAHMGHIYGFDAVSVQCEASTREIVELIKHIKR